MSEERAWINGLDQEAKEAWKELRMRARSDTNGIFRSLWRVWFETEGSWTDTLVNDARWKDGQSPTAPVSMSIFVGLLSCILGVDGRTF